MRVVLWGIRDANFPYDADGNPQEFVDIQMKADCDQGKALL